MFAAIGVALGATNFGYAASYTITDLAGPYTNLGSAFVPAGVNNSGQVGGGWGFPVFRAGWYGSGTFYDLGVLPAPGPAGAGESGGTGINAGGQVVGWSVGDFVTEFQHAFVTVGGVMTDLGALAPAGTDSSAEGINDSGQVVGYAGAHAFLYSAGALSDLGTLPGGDTSRAYAINNSGQVVGSGNAADGFTRALLYDGGVMTDLGWLAGGNSSTARDINGSGRVVGFSNAADGFLHPFLYDGGVMSDLGLPAGATTGEATAINASGQIVGNSNAGPFLYSGGTMQPLNALIDPMSGWALDTAVSISDTGYIVGQGTIGGETHGYLLTLVPEPSTVVLCASAATAFGACSLHRRRRLRRRSRIQGQSAADAAARGRKKAQQNFG